MPLKHSTETFLLALLAVVIVVTGIACAVLPLPTVNPVPWAVLFSLSIAYPLALYPLFRERRADNAFRLLHFLPALILLVWLGLSLFASGHPILSFVRRWFTWGWSLPVVAISFFALLWFCLDVLRQRMSRVILLLVLLVPFLAFAVIGENNRWPTRVASVLNTQRFGSSSSTAIVAVTVASQSNLSKSPHASEEQYRANLRRMERRTARLAALQSSVPSVKGATVGAMIANDLPVVSQREARITHLSPNLTSSGPATEAMMVMFVAMYCAVLHVRARRRNFIVA